MLIQIFGGSEKVLRWTVKCAKRFFPDDIKSELKSNLNKLMPVFYLHLFPLTQINGRGVNRTTLSTNKTQLILMKLTHRTRLHFLKLQNGTSAA